MYDFIRCSRSNGVLSSSTAAAVAHFGSLCMTETCEHRITHRSIDSHCTDFLFILCTISIDKNQPITICFFLSFLYKRVKSSSKKNWKKKKKKIIKKPAKISLKTLNEFSIHWMWLPRVFCYYVTENLFTKTHTLTQKPPSNNIYNTKIQMTVWNDVFFCSS